MTLKSGQVQRGIWLTSGTGILAELAGTAGFDWCLIDGEHGPNTVSEILPQLQALAISGTPAVVRVANAEAWMIKQVLDLGCQTVVVPMVDDAQTADAMARAMRYPPQGNRGMGASLLKTLMRLQPLRVWMVCLSDPQICRLTWVIRGSPIIQKSKQP